MKNKRFKIFFIVLSIIFIVYVIADTFSRFISTATGNGNISVAKWQVLIRKDEESEGIDISDAGEHDISTEIKMTPEDNASVAQGKIAPRSKFTGSFIIDPCDTDVNLEYTFSIGNIEYTGETEPPNIEVDNVKVNGTTVTLDSDNSYSDVIDINSDDYDGEPIKVEVTGVWSPKERDNATGIELGKLEMPVNVNVEQCYARSTKIVDLYNSGELAIGDWVTYDAGTWTSEEIANIKVGPNNEELVQASGSSSKPSKKFQFGGFTAGMSRNAGATPYSTTYDYAYMYDDGNSSKPQRLSGWRVWDIDKDKGEIVLISAANPEDYYHANITEGAYKAQYILTGTKNGSWTEKETAEENYTIRDWSMYVNPKYKAQSARPITYTDLKNWYSKYTGGTSLAYGDTASFGKIYNPYSSYQNLVDNHSYYWLSVAYGAANVYGVNPYIRSVSNGHDSAFGVRVLVSISLNSKVEGTPIAERTVTEDGMVYNGGTWGPETVQEYNVWKLK